ncbi:RAP domain-containing protein [Cardiosporidium cionae]|uniref:RAP domain-containing protein n=1 Tax=Cardiosporidium cionae TaxID=476202 RepID=A0ABQ7JA13_9APIC|nr:RAP domain-containing protein [Cardiosporidium cionae]|eukprot:KAF8820835.1 RAP domain-containing protein [Cardiosporidium cionae]
MVVPPLETYRSTSYIATTLSPSTLSAFSHESAETPFEAQKVALPVLPSQTEHPIPEVDAVQLPSSKPLIAHKSFEKTLYRPPPAELQSNASNQNRAETLSWMQSADVLVKLFFKSAKANVRDEKLWKEYAQRAISMAPYMAPTDIAVTFYCFAKIRYYDERMINTISPYIVQFIEEFSVWGLVMMLNAFRKLEIAKFGTIELIAQQLCTKNKQLTSQDVALCANALGFFYIYHPPVWKKLIETIHELGPSMAILHVAIVVEAMAKLDIREPHCLRLLSNIAKKEGKHLSSELLAGMFCGFIKLDYNSPSLVSQMKNPLVSRLAHAMALPERERTLGRRNDTFDVQSLSNLTFSLICLIGCTDEVCMTLLQLLSKRLKNFNDEKLKKLKAVELMLRLCLPKVYNSLDKEILYFLKMVEKTPLSKNVSRRSARWAYEVQWCLHQMQIKFSLQASLDGQALDIALLNNNVIIKCAGPHSFYVNELKRTAYSKLQQRLLQAEGKYVAILPYYDWNALQSVEDKKDYLRAFGRRTAEKMAQQHWIRDRDTHGDEFNSPGNLSDSEPTIPSAPSDINEGYDFKEDGIYSLLEARRFEDEDWSGEEVEHSLRSDEKVVTLDELKEFTKK